MPLVSLPANVSAAATQRAGLAMLNRLANVQAVVAGVPVVGWRRRRPDQAAMTDLAVQATSDQLVVATADLPAGVDPGTSIVIDGQAWAVATRSDHVELGHTRLDIERAV